MSIDGQRTEHTVVQNLHVEWRMKATRASHPEATCTVEDEHWHAMWS